MDRIKTITVFVDPNTRDHPAIAKAARLAAGFRARIDLVVIDPTAAASASNFYDAETCRLAQERRSLPRRERLETLAEPLRAAGLTVHTDVLFDTPLSAAMIRRIRTSRPSLVVKDTHPHSLIHRAWLSHLDWYLIRECPAPLLLTRARAWHERALRIAAAVDPGHADDKPWTLDHEILGTVEYLATGVASDLSVVNAFCSLEQYAVLGGAGDPQFAVVCAAPVEAARRQQHEALRRLMVGHQIAPESVHLVEGSPVEALPAFAVQHHIDVLVMGVIARGSLFEHVVGSTAERVLDRLECDVLALKPETLFAQLWKARG
ncbi:MAG: universal stress protein [Proteobacteria bacterium]|nr:universal stress protein [Pseudomonadota bacterium]